MANSKNLNNRIWDKLRNCNFTGTIITHNMEIVIVIPFSDNRTAKAEFDNLTFVII